MGIEKSEVKRATANEIGGAIEDVLEQARIAQSRKAGAADAWRDATKSLEGLLAHVSKEADEGNLDLEQVKLVKTWLLRGVNGCRAAAEKHLREFHVAMGKVEALEAAVAVTKRVFDREDSKARAGDNGVDEERRGRLEGTRPPVGIKARRQAEEAAAAADAPPAKKSPAKAPAKAPAKKKKAPAKGADAAHT